MSYPNHDAGPPKRCKLCDTVYVPTPGQRVQKYCQACGEKLKAPLPWAKALKRENTDLKRELAALKTSATLEPAVPGRARIV